MKKLLSLFICFAILLTGTLLWVSAAPVPHKPGDVDSDSEVTVKDATLVQKYIAKLCELSKSDEYWADVDDDSDVTIKDATMIQKYVADIIDGFDIEAGYIHISRTSMYSDFDSGMAMAGVPVTFTVLAEGYKPPFSYELLVDGEVVTKRSENNVFTYTFEEAGAYFITLRVYNSFDVSSESFTYYEVVEPYESEVPVIKAFYYDKNFFVGEYNPIMDSADTDVTLTAEAIMGSGDYEYCFLMDGEVVQDFSKNNKYIIKEVPVSEKHTFTVYVRDSNTGENYVSKTLEVNCDYIEG